MRQILYRMTTLLLIGTLEVQAGEWVGPDVLNTNFSNWSVSGTSSIYETDVSGGNLRMGFLPRPAWVINTNLNHTMTASRSVSVTPGKRYRYEVSARERRSVQSGSINVEWWSAISGGPSTSQSSSTNYVTRSATYVPGGSSMTVSVKSRITASPVAQLLYDYAEYDWATLHQVVYDPQMDIAQDALRINTDSPGGSTANISLGLNSLSFADNPTAWSIDWGDGFVEQSPALNTSNSHQYNIPNGNSATWTATLSGSNEAGNDSDTALVEVLSQPDIALSVNGQSVFDGETIEIDIINYPVLDLSLLESLGYIEATSFFIPGRLDWSDSNLVLGTSIFDEFDIGQVFSLEASISNTGFGINSDYLAVNLSVIPEPSTAMLLGVSGCFVCRRRRRS